MGFSLLFLQIIVALSLVRADDAVIETNQWPVPEEVPSLANGHLGFVIYGNSILMNGLYNGHKGESHRARIPNFSNISTNALCNQDNCAYTLNMRKGFFQNVINFGSTHRLTQQMYAHRFFNRAIFNHFRLERVASGRWSVPLLVTAGEVPGVDLTETKTVNENISGINVQIKCFETNVVEDIRYQPMASKVCVGFTVPPNELTLETLETFKEFLHITTVARTENEVRQELQNITDALIKGDDLFLNHTSTWEGHWNRFEISAEGNSNTNQIVHSSMFYLISNLPSEETNQVKDPFWGLSPGGIPKGGVLYMEYQGHSFWDTEMWMHPPLLLFNPKWSEEILNYRFMVRKAAADNALNTGYKGYRYPWESGFTGSEVTPDCCPEVVEYQHHIISDIAFAFRSHLAATRDLDWWQKVGCDVAFNTAKFWESRVRYNASTQLYDIRNVMGPDEDHHDIDNNVYTNVIAAINLYFGDYAGCACKDVLGTSQGDYEKFAKIAKSLTLLYDEVNDIHPQFEGYTGDEIKQADVVLLGYPLQYPMKASTKRNDLLYYDNKTRVNGPAMTWSMHTIGFLDLEDEEKASTYFEKSHSLYTREPFKVWSEAIPGQPAAGNFITGAGGFLQSVINGYGGVRLQFDHLKITKSYLPKDSTSLTFKGITYLNNVFSLSIEQNYKNFSVVSFDPTHVIRVTVDGVGYGDLKAGFAVSIPHDREIILRPMGERCAMKETIVGVKTLDKPVEFVDDEWTLGSNYLPEYFDIPSLSNGHIGFVVFGNSILLNGLYNGEKGESHRARIPNFSNITTNMQCNRENCAYQLHLKRGFFEKTLYDGNNFKVTQHIYAHRFYNRAIINRIVLERLDGTAEESVELSLAPGDEESIDLTLLEIKNDTINGHNVVTRCYETKLIEDPKYQLFPSKVCVSHTELPAKLTIAPGQGISEFLHVTAVGRTAEEVRKELFDIFTKENVYTFLFEKHSEVWEGDMDKYGISVTNNKELNQVIHSSMFYLLSNLPSTLTNQPNDPFWGLSPSGIAKGGVALADYQGHSFWDTEMWMHPPLLLFNPKWSEEILNYRFMVRKAAADNALNTGYKGYRYPWESGFTGSEVTPDCCPHVVEYQHHIISDIAFAFRSHLAATHDIDWWQKVGCDVAFNTAKFWESRVEYNDTEKFYHILSVMGPDEDHNDTDNNVYTNVNAAINLYFGDFAACACKDILKLTDEDYQNFSKIARSLKLLYNEEKDFHPQYETYEDDEIKQADVVLVGYPLQFPMADSTKRNNLLFYSNVTRPTGPAMTWSMHTIGYLDIQDQVEAAKNFDKSWSVYTHLPFLTWSENQPGMPAAGNFITGIGGFLQSLINGYGGVRLHFDHLSISNFYTPPNSASLEINSITYLKNRFSLSIIGRTATLKFLEVDLENPIIMTVTPYNEKISPSEGLVVNFDREDKLVMEPMIKAFGSCELKKTELGYTAATANIKISFFLIALAVLIKSIIC